MNSLGINDVYLRKTLELYHIAFLLAQNVMSTVSDSIDTIPYDTGLEAPFAHSLYAVYFRKSTPCCLARLTFEPEPWPQVGKFRPMQQTEFSSYGSNISGDKKCI